jgi:hypothetical protein
MNAKKAGLTLGLFRVRPLGIRGNLTRHDNQQDYSLGSHWGNTMQKHLTFLSHHAARR